LYYSMLAWSSNAWYNLTMKGRFLKLAKHDLDKEVAFELDFLAGLTVEERVALVLERSALLLEMLTSNGHSQPPGITKRK
jgi:hypothetical protein